MSEVTCCYCGRPLGGEYKATREHLVPQSLGGNDSEFNILQCCTPCNSWRSNKSYLDWCREVETYLSAGKAPHYQPHHLQAILKNVEYIQEYIQKVGHRLTAEQSPYAGPEYWPF